MNAIEIKNLCKTYRGKRRALVYALQDLDLSIHSGEVFGFLGPNGAGKSTTIKLLTGQIKAGCGSAELYGVPVGDPNARKRLGYLPENPSFYGHMSAREHLRFAGSIHGLSKEVLQRESDRILDLFELSQSANRPVKGFSKGMTQRLGLAVALLPDPDLLILDEPMSGLDPLGRALVKKVIRDLKGAGKTIFFSTHITADVEALCDRIGIIVNGRLRTVDEVQDLMQKGVAGYQLRYMDATGQISELVVAKNELRKEMDNLFSRGLSIEGVDPCRRDLENYFLEVVNSHAAID